MTGPEALRSVQFIVADGERFAVLSAEAWEAFMDWLEALEDAQILRRAFAELKAAGGDPRRAGWREWSEVADEISESDDAEEEEFDEEIAATCRNTRLMALLEERARQTETIPLADVKRQLGLGD